MIPAKFRNNLRRTSPILFRIAQIFVMIMRIVRRRWRLAANGGFGLAALTALPILFDGLWPYRFFAWAIVALCLLGIAGLLAAALVNALTHRAGEARQVLKAGLTADMLDQISALKADILGQTTALQVRLEEQSIQLSAHESQLAKSREIAAMWQGHLQDVVVRINSDRSAFAGQLSDIQTLITSNADRTDEQISAVKTELADFLSNLDALKTRMDDEERRNSSVFQDALEQVETRLVDKITKIEAHHQQASEAARDTAKQIDALRSANQKIRAVTGAMANDIADLKKGPDKT